MMKAVFLLLLCVAIINGEWGNPDFKYFGYYTYHDTDYLEFTGSANLIYVNNITSAAAAHKKGFNVMFWAQETFFSQPPMVIRDDYLSSWKELAAIAAPLIQDGTLFGFMMGDELMQNGLSYDSLNISINIIKQTFPSAIVYYNEAFPIFAYGKVSVLFPMLDWISIDSYPAYGQNLESTYEIYANHIYPTMLPHQRVMVVPPGYGTVNNNQQYCGNPDCQNANIGWVQQAFSWALGDPHFVGLFAWHWDPFTDQYLPGFELGVESLPYLKEAYFKLGTQVVNQNLSYSEIPNGGICGLGTNQDCNTTCAGHNSFASCPPGFDQQIWDIGITGSGSMAFCSLSNSSQELPVGAICGLNLMSGQVVMCGGMDPYLQDPYCPKGYARQEWAPTNWGGGSFFYCAKTEPGPDVMGTICGMMTGDVGVFCNGVNPQIGCPAGYAPASWEIPFGNGVWSVCFLL